jgi:hypothetical protein
MLCWLQLKAAGGAVSGKKHFYPYELFLICEAYNKALWKYLGSKGG